MGEETTTIVADALASIAQAAPARKIARCHAGDPWDASADTFVFSYRKDFAELWGIGNSAGKSGGLSSVASGLFGRVVTLAVVWDGIPVGNTGHVATAGYLTPIDWAVALSLSVERLVSAGKRNISSTDCPSLRILVLDIASHNVANSSSDLFARQFPKRDVMSMPWIRLFSPVVDNDKGWDAGNLIDNLASTDACNAVPTMREAFADGKHDLDAVRRLWSTFLTKPVEADDHHAIANLMGPMLLMGETSQHDLNMQAFRCLMEAIGLVPGMIRGGSPEDDAGSGSLILREGHAWYVKDSREKQLKLLLLDDQWRQGWGEVICKAVGVPYQPGAGGGPDLVSLGRDASGIEVKAADSVEWLVQRLEKNGSNDRRFKLTLDDDANAEELLFLDLRLFSGKPIKDEAHFIERLVRVAEGFPAGANLPWPGFTADELSRVREWTRLATASGATNELRNDPRYHEALTVLARIISLVDLSYPIVLFSSTGKKRIVDSLRGYGNVITCFGKPEISVLNHDDYIDQVKGQFLAAMTKARSFLRARERCRSFVDAANPYEANSRQLDASKFYHVEFYIDETNPHEHEWDLFRTGRGPKPSYTGWRVGGCFAVFEGGSKEEVMTIADRFEDTLVKDGVRYFVWEPNGPQPDKVLQKKTTSCTPCLSKTLEKTSPVYLGIASLYQETEATRPFVVGLFDVHHDDQLFLTTLRALVEAFIYESMHAIFGNEASFVSLSLFAATRINCILENRENGDVAEMAMADDWRAGVTWKCNETREGTRVDQHTFREGDFAPILRSVRALRSSDLDIIRALAVPLFYVDGKKTTPDRFVCWKCRISVPPKSEIVQPGIGTSWRGNVINIKIDKNGKQNSVVQLSQHHWGIVFGSNLTIDQYYDFEITGVPTDKYRNYKLKVISPSTQCQELGKVRGPVRCPVCDTIGNVRPDSRALHYVADQVLTDMFGNGSRKYHPIFGALAPGEFEDSVNEFGAVLSASRALDNCDFARAVIDFPLVSKRQILIKNNDEKNHKPAIRDYVRYRIGASLAIMKGDVFTNIAEREQRTT